MNRNVRSCVLPIMFTFVESYDNDGKKAYRLNIVNIKTWKETVRWLPTMKFYSAVAVLMASLKVSGFEFSQLYRVTRAALAKEKRFRQGKQWEKSPFKCSAFYIVQLTPWPPTMMSLFDQFALKQLNWLKGKLCLTMFVSL